VVQTEADIRLQCLPVIISLETSDLQFIADRALSLHSTLHAKHPDLISIRFVDFARAAFEYQASRKPMEDILGTLGKFFSGQYAKGIGYRITDRPTALFHGWYGLVRDKRAWRQDMLKAFSKIFQIDPAKSTISAVCFVTG
jgi:cohesin loading factor subunit SCC2